MLQLDAVQERAVAMALAEPVSIITGGPGRGKTTITREIIRRMLAADPKAVILLATPTGRAARRMAELTGREASTIHRLLEYHPEKGFRRNAAAPLSGDLLLVDECSMIDLPLMASLLAAIPPKMRVVFIGDADQLPPVGPGAPFRDMIRSGRVPVVRLDRIYRQDAGSLIARNAERINVGLLPVIEPGNPSYAIRPYVRGARGAMAADTLQAVRQLLDEGFRPDEIQVLVPRRDGVLGTQTLNPKLRESLNPGGGGRGVFRAGEREFWIGDRVMQLSNDYAKGVFNGEIGSVLRVEEAEERDPLTGRERTISEMVVGYEDGSGVREIRYAPREAHEVDLAYACTIHKSQGGEFRAVVMALGWDGFLLLRRNLAYTGVSRARERVVLLWEEGALERAVANSGAEERHSALAEWLAAV